jgi:hypothetical protein
MSVGKRRPLKSDIAETSPKGASFTARRKRMQQSLVASVQIEETKLSHAKLPRSEHENLESDLRGSWKREFFEVPYHMKAHCAQ